MILFLHPFLTRLTQKTHLLWRAVMDFLLPPLCLNCDSPVTENQTLCGDCWKAIHFISPPFCARCGAPFDLPVDEGSLCGACLEHPPEYDAGRSAFLYDEASKGLIIRLKHADQLHPLPALASWMVRAGEEFWGQTDIIVPVPLHRWRLFKRRYNQAALLALEIGRKTGRCVEVDLLQRIRATESQGHKNRKERYTNLIGAFAVKEGRKIEGMRIVLIDDVMTSGATSEACTKVLKKAGAANVFVVTLARTRIAS